MPCCPNCSFGIAANGEFCHCDSGQKRADLDKRRLQELQVQAELRHTQAVAIGRGEDTIPPKMRGFTFHSYRAAISRRFSDGDQSKSEALSMCIEYSGNFHLLVNSSPAFNLIMTGNVGTGKTGLTVPILKAGIKAGMSAGYIDFTIFMSRCHAAELNEKEKSILNVSALDILAIDDLGTAERSTNGKLKPESPDAIRVATQILNYRIQNMLPTLITSNLGVDGLSTQFGDRLASRLIESSFTVWVGGRDMRLDNVPSSPPRL